MRPAGNTQKWWVSNIFILKIIFSPMSSTYLDLAVLVWLFCNSVRNILDERSKRSINKSLASTRKRNSKAIKKRLKTLGRGHRDSPMCKQQAGGTEGDTVTRGSGGTYLTLIFWAGPRATTYNCPPDNTPPSIHLPPSLGQRDSSNQIQSLRTTPWWV